MICNFMQKLTLRGGGVIPSVGLGVYKFDPDEYGKQSILAALHAGYRHIDTAQFYQNEKEVGEAVIESGIPREDLFITTKLWLSNFGYQNAVEAIQTSLAKLNTPYIDLLLLHAPGEPSLRAETWKALEQLQRAGTLKNIGVSNFGIPHLQKLALTAEIPPAVNQIEVHPWLQRVELVRYCQEQGIVVQAYSPLAKASKLSDPVLVEIATRLGHTPAQVLIAWSLQKGFVTLPKSVNPERQITNLAAHRITLTGADIALLETLEEYFTTGWDPVKTAAV